MRCISNLPKATIFIVYNDKCWQIAYASNFKSISERSIIKQAKAEVKCRKEEIFVFVFAKLYNGTVNEIITPRGVNTKFKASEMII